MPTRNVVLTDRQEKLIEKLVKTGEYQNASEVLREGLRLLEQRRHEDEAKLKALRAAVQVGIDDIEAGRYREFSTAEELRAYVSEIADRAISASSKRHGRKRTQKRFRPART